MTGDVVVVILTFNSERVIEDTIRSALLISPEIICVDSHSSDSTRSICEKLGARVFTRTFKNYSDQRNWAIKQVEQEYDWQLHLDADELLDQGAVDGIKAVLAERAYSAYLIRRKTYFMGRPLNFGGTATWHLRLFRSGVGRCEDRLYDQHFISSHKVGRINSGWMHDKNAGSLSEWTSRHNRWSDLESEEFLLLGGGHRTGRQLQARLSGDSRERTRYLKGRYYHLPLFWRSTAYFLYRYFIRLGFADGRVGFIYCVLQAFWFRVLIDAKIFERISLDKAPDRRVGDGSLSK